MPIEIKMPALSPTMEEGTLAKWLVKEGDAVKSGDIMAEIETDKATMEFEAVDEGTVGKIVVPEGTDGVKVGAVILVLEGEDDLPSPRERGEGGERSAEGEGQSGDTASPTTAPLPASPSAQPPASGRSGSQPDLDRAGRDQPDAPQRGDGGKRDEAAAIKSEWPAPEAAQGEAAAAKAPASPPSGDRIKASPLARRVAAERGIELAALAGSGPNGRIVRADVEGARAGAAIAPSPAAAPEPTAAPPAPGPAQLPDIPHQAAKLSNMRKVIARRLTESKQQVPHIYLTVDVRLDRLLALRAELNDGLAARGVKLSVNDLLIKALAVALVQVPKCNVMFTPDQLVTFERADISVAVSTPEGLITPVVTEADTASLSSIATRMKDLAARARERKLKPDEYAGGTASLSNMGMFGIKQFEAVINPPQGMILAVGAGEPRPHVIDGALGIATVMSATGSFDHRAIDGADGAALMAAFKALVERPLAMLA